MKKKLVVLILTFIVFISIFIISGCVDNENDVYNVVRIKGKEKEFSSINEALGESVDGDTILVSKGTYNENINLYKSVSLIGENKDNTIIDAHGLGDGIYIFANSVKISGFTIKNAGTFGYSAYDSGIDIRSNNNLISGNNIVNNSMYGIYVVKGSNNTFADNFISDSLFGIFVDGEYAYQLNNINISGNTILNNSEKAIYLSYSFNSKISNNFVSKNYYGLHMQHCDDNVVSGNTFSNNIEGLFFCCGTEDNVVFSNVFVNNTEYNAKSNTENEFDYSGVGNYWDDYKGVDEDGDGIGDTPYHIIQNEYIDDLENKDNYPILDLSKLKNQLT